MLQVQKSEQCSLLAVALDGGILNIAVLTSRYRQSGPVPGTCVTVPVSPRPLEAHRVHAMNAKNGNQLTGARPGAAVDGNPLRVAVNGEAVRGAHKVYALEAEGSRAGQI